MAQETWRDKETGDLYAVEVENGDVKSAMGPFSEADAAQVDIHGETMQKMKEIAGEKLQDKLAWISDNKHRFERV